MNRHRELAQMMRAAAGTPPDSPFPWVHKWDFTAESGGSIPDLINGVSLALTGSYSSSSAGIRPTAGDASAEAPVESLDIDVAHQNTSTYTILVAVSDTYSSGVGNIYGRYFDSYISSADDLRGARMYLTNNSTDVSYQTLASTTTTVITVPTVLGKPSSVAVDTDPTARVWVSGGGVFAGYNTAEYEVIGDLRLMNRDAHDRAGDAMFVGAGIISQILTDQELIDATAELLAL